MIDLVPKFSESSIFQIFTKTNQKELVDILYHSKQNAIHHELVKQLKDKDFDYLSFLDSSFYPIEMIQMLILNLSSEQAFLALIFHMSSEYIYQIRKKEMNDLLKIKLQQEDFEYLPIFFRIYYGDSPLPEEFLKTAIRYLNGKQAFNVLVDYRITDSNLKERIFQEKKREISSFLEQKLQEKDFNCINIFLGNIRSLPLEFVKMVLDSLDLNQAVDVIMNYSDYNDEADQVRNYLYFHHKEQIDLMLRQKLQDKNFDYTSIFDFRKNIPPLMLNNFIQNFNISQVFKTCLYDIRLANKKQICEIHQIKLNEIIQSKMGMDKDYHILLNKKISLNAFDLILDYVDPKEIIELLDLKPQQNNRYIEHAYAKMYHLNLEEKSVKEMFLMLPFFRGSREEFIENFKQIEYFLSSLGIKSSYFWQYNLSNRPSYFSNIVSIIKSNDLEKFKMVKDYFFQNIYAQPKTMVAQIHNLTNLIENYQFYPELCTIVSQNQLSLTQEEKNRILFLFYRNEKFTGKDKPCSIEECFQVNATLKKRFFDQLKNMKSLDKDTLKNIICMMLFNDSLISLKEKLAIYGNTEELLKLQFNNRADLKMVEEIEGMMIYTSMIEEIIRLNSKEKLCTLANNIFIHLDVILNSSFCVDHFSLKMRSLYALESERGTTKIGLQTNAYRFVLDQERTKAYGVDVYDFSDKEYVIYAHVVSPSEKISDIILGKATGESNFICLNPISYRNQVYYFDRDDDLIVGYDHVDKENFIMSSSTNMDSNHNGSIQRNSSEVCEVFRKQRGILETSDASGVTNSETLCFRENLRPRYVILPNGRSPSAEEISLCKKYNLTLLVTQKSKTGIKNPKKIPIDYMEKERKKDKIRELTSLKQQLFQYHDDNQITRKIAIFADAHGLFESTLAILEDARRNGIREIYSLGDNVGTGPNPSEVLNLMKQYGVKSVMGNHELYITKGVEVLRQYLEKRNCLEETLENSRWTKNQLSQEQIKNIEVYPLCRELIVGDKKILLCHSVKDLNTGKLFVNSKKYDKIFQGHTHFKEFDKNVYTLRGAGIEYQKLAERGKAYYLILSVKKNGTYQIKEKYVPYDAKNLKGDIELSTLNHLEKEKINSWAIGKGR